ncbi:SDR family NAD(P)-dependent oxidoreductase [Nonomuraea guangzhouensis]|uniref:SDR family NAD(P)-dependent oxidoreductase n=1 Tax=Nonomuraea guangzhouensis TaxID=1291555 RepID=A0ABW4GKD1_9ACTN|nr:SDR family NAD(P)-dependent oxidoreductase [Nonomuraea guangzhouensis]
MTHDGTVLLTGATGGIGSAIARALLDAGYRVLAVVRDPSHLGALGSLDERCGADDATGPGGRAHKAIGSGLPGAVDEIARPGGPTEEAAGPGEPTEQGTSSVGLTEQAAGSSGPGAVDDIARLGEITPMAANLPWPGMMTPATPSAGATPTGVTIVVADLARPETLATALPDIGELDAFVHCAGIAEVAATADSPVELWRDTFNVNVVSAAELLRLLLPALRRRRGRVVLINAAPGLSPRGWPAYAASKAALRELGDAVRAEEDPHGIRVTTIYPGGTATELLRKVRADFGSPYDPDQCLRPSTVAALVLTALTTSPDAHLTELSVGSAG